MERDAIDFPEALRRLAGRAGVELSRADQPRGRAAEATARGARRGDRLLPPRPDREPPRPAGARLPAQPRLHRRDARRRTSSATRSTPGTRSRRRSSTSAASPRRTSRPRASSRKRAGPARRLRPFPRPDHLPHPGRLGQRDRPRRPDRRQRAGARGRPRPGPQVPQLAGDAALRQEPHAVPHRPRQVGHPQERRSRCLVEGNTDALMAHQQGFDNVVGTLGTALTPAQVELVTRYAPRIALAYDVDAAGQGAATFGATELSALVGEIERSAHQGRLDGRRRRAAAGRPRPGRGHARRPGRVAHSNERAAADRGVPDRPLRQAPRPAHARRPRAARGGGDADHPPRDQPHPARRLPAAAGAAQRRRGPRAARGAAPAGADRPRGRSAAGRPMSGRRSTSRPCCPARTRSIPEAVARTLEPVESSLLRAAAPPARTCATGSAIAARIELFVTHAGARALAALEATPASRLRPRRRSSTALDPTLAAVARTLFARTDPLPDDDERSTRRSSRAC